MFQTQPPSYARHLGVRVREPRHTSWVRLPLLATTLALLCALALQAHAQSGPQGSIRLDNLGEVASSAFISGAGAGAREEVRSAAAARGELPNRLTSFESMLAPAFNITENAGAESVGIISLWFEAGPRYQREARAAEAQERGAEARAESERWAFIVGAQRRYLQWWQAASVATHLREDIDGLNDELDALERAVEAGYLPRLELLDLRGELARLRGELVTVERSAFDAAIETQRYLAVDLPLAAPEDAHPLLEAAHRGEAPRTSEQALQVDDPWSRIAGAIERFPSVVALRESAEAQRREAELTRSAPVELGVGAEVHHIAQSDATWGAAQLSVRIPLQRGERRQAAYLRGDASAALLDAEWEARTLRSWIRGQVERVALLRATIERVEAEWIRPQQERVAALEEAFSSGHISAPRLILARRDLHEALHQNIELQAELMVLLEAGAQLEALLDDFGVLAP